MTSMILLQKIYWIQNFMKEKSIFLKFLLYYNFYCTTNNIFTLYIYNKILKIFLKIFSFQIILLLQIIHVR